MSSFSLPIKVTLEISLVPWGFYCSNYLEILVLHILFTITASRFFPLLEWQHIWWRRDFLFWSAWKWSKIIPRCYNKCEYTLLKDFIYLFIFREREGEREGEKHQCVVALHTTPTGDLACNPILCPDWELNHPPLGSQAGTQSTEPHQPGLNTL